MPWTEEITINTTNVSGILHADNKAASQGDQAKHVPSVHKRRTKRIHEVQSGTLFGADGEQQPSDVGDGSILRGNDDILIDP